MLQLENSYSELTPRRGRDLATVAVIEILVVLAAWLFLRHSHVMPGPKVLAFGVALGISVFNGLLVTALVSRGQYMPANLVYVVLLFVRAVLIGLPDSSGLTTGLYVLAFSTPIIAADLLVNRAVATVVAVLSAVAYGLIAMLNPTGSLMPPASHAVPYYVVVLFNLIVLVGDGILLGTFGGEPYVAFANAEPEMDDDEDDSKRHLTTRELADALTLAMRSGVLMLTSGAAGFRTEDVMHRVAAALGVNRLDTYMSPNGIVGSAYSGKEHRTQIAKVPRFGVAMDRVVELETYSHALRGNETPAEVTKALDKIAKMKPIYPFVLLMAAAGVACGSIAIGFVHGNWQGFVAACCGAFTAQSVRILMHRSHKSPLLTTAVCAFITTTISVLVTQALHGPHPEFGVMASVLLLVPGVPLVTAIVDFTRLDLLSGCARGILAGLQFVCIAFGMLMGLLLTGFNIIK